MGIFDNPRQPPAINRLRRWILVVPFWMVIGVVQSRYWMDLPHWAKSKWISFSPAAGMLVTMVVIVGLDSRLRRRARAADYRLCPQCLYPLEGDAGVCPECGRPFTAAGLQDLWRGRL